MLSSYAQSGTCHVVAVGCANCADHTATVNAVQWLTKPVEISEPTALHLLHSNKYVTRTNKMHTIFINDLIQ
jgi:hypothetical protein